MYSRLGYLDGDDPSRYLNHRRGVSDYELVVPPGGSPEKLVLCDKETNTDRRGGSAGRSLEAGLVRSTNENAARSSSIRRWQTFSPMGISEEDYRCRVSGYLFQSYLCKIY